MEQVSPSGKDEERGAIKLEFEPAKETASLLVNLAFFVSAIKAYQTATNVRSKRNEIQRILSAGDWYVHYTDKNTGRRVLSESIRIEYDHERRTAINLAQMNYDVVFAPNGIFNRNQKKFDVYLLRDTIILEADMKSVTSRHQVSYFAERLNRRVTKRNREEQINKRDTFIL